MAQHDCKECGGAGRIFYQKTEQVPVYTPGLIRIAKQGWPRRNPDGSPPSDSALVEEIREKLRKGEPLDATKPGMVQTSRTCDCVLIEKVKSYLGEYAKVKYSVPEDFYSDAWHGSVLVVDELDWFKSAVNRVLRQMIMNEPGKFQSNLLPKPLTTTPYDIMTRRARPDYHTDEGEDPFDKLGLPALVWVG